VNLATHTHGGDVYFGYRSSLASGRWQRSVRPRSPPTHLPLSKRHENGPPAARYSLLSPCARPNMHMYAIYSLAIGQALLLAGGLALCARTHPPTHLPLSKSHVIGPPAAQRHLLTPCTWPHTQVGTIYNLAIGQALLLAEGFALCARIHLPTHLPLSKGHINGLPAAELHLLTL
jgi:hypothetical protein